MKQSTSLRILFASCMLLSFLMTTAQTDLAVNAFLKAPDFHPEKGTWSGYGPELTTKVSESFSKLFRNAVEVRWFALDDNFQARFSKNGHDTRAVFNPAGTMVYSVSEIKEQDLPSDIRKDIRDEYVGSRVIKAVEVNTMGKTAWVVKLEDDSSIFSVTILDGEMTQTEHYWRSR